MLNLKNVSKIYGEDIHYQALDNLSLDVEKGEFVGVMGPSGSGKTTLLNIIATIEGPTSGDVLINQSNPYLLSQEELAAFRRHTLGFIFQSFNLLPTLTVEENIVLPLTLDGGKVAVMQEKANDVAKRLGIADLMTKRISEISGGQAQRVAVARAMIHQPELVLADEPTGNLDTKSSNDVMHLLQKLNREEQATMLMVTHDPMAASYCSRIIFIKDGKLVKEIKRSESQRAFYDQIVQLSGELEGAESEF